MNERIRELAEQAGCKAFVDEYAPFKQEFEKFAELIVKECAKVANGGWADPGYQIKTHFGVEE